MPPPAGVRVTDHPRLAEPYAELLDHIWRSGVPVSVLELCRLRVAGLLHDDEGASSRTPAACPPAGRVDEAMVGALPRWPTDPRFGPAERAALAVAEQFVVDGHGITDAQVDELRLTLGDRDAVGLLFALAVFDGFSRATAVLEGF